MIIISTVCNALKKGYALFERQLDLVGFGFIAIENSYPFN